MEALKQHCPDSIEEAEITNNMDMSNLVFNPPTDGSNPEGTSSGTGDSKCDNIKWVFCFIFKFILGPGGFFIIKLLPHMIKFFYATKESFNRIFTGLLNKMRSVGILPGDKQRYYYYGKKVDEDGKVTFGIVDNYYPGFLDTIFSYLGSVIPWNYANYNWGQRYGKGQFGKLIVGLVIVSAVIIIIGGVGVTMLFLCFAFYCIKTLSMFSDNIKEKSKGKA